MFNITIDSFTMFLVVAAIMFIALTVVEITGELEDRRRYKKLKEQYKQLEKDYMELVEVVEKLEES